METMTKTCKNCNKEFECLTKEHDRNNANFCSLSCVAIYTNNNREEVIKNCKHCGNEYNTSANNSKYCSSSCKQKNYRLTSKHILPNQKRLMDNIRSLPCAICNWKDSTRDVHHIVPVSQGGKNEESNLITLCPNHHRMVHNNLVSQDSLYKAIEYRTISSSSLLEE